MHDYDLSKIAKLVADLYDEKGIWPDYVALPEAEYKAIFGFVGVHGSRSVKLSNGEPRILYYKAFFDTRSPEAHYSIPLANTDTVKDKPQKPPGYHVSSACDTCLSIGGTIGNHHCTLHGYPVNSRGLCDDYK